MATFGAARFPRFGRALRRRPLCHGRGSRRVRASAILAGTSDRESSRNPRSPLGGRPFSLQGVRRAAPHGSRARRRALQPIVPDRSADAWRRRAATRCRHRADRRNFRWAGLAQCDCTGRAKRFGLRALCRKKLGAGCGDARARADGVDRTLPGRSLRPTASCAGRLCVKTSAGGPANDRNCGPFVTIGLHRSFEV